MIICIPLAHEFNAGKRSALIIRLDNGVAKSLLIWEDMCNATWISIHLGPLREELLGNLKHFGVPAELFLQQAQLRQAHGKPLKTALLGNLGCCLRFQRPWLADSTSFA